MSSSNVSFSNPLHDIEIPTVAPGTLTTPGTSNTSVTASPAAPYTPVTSDAEAGLPNESTISHTLASGEAPTVHQQRRGRPPFTFLYWSICNLIFCCPVGCVALMFSMAAQSSVDKGMPLGLHIRGLMGVPYVLFRPHKFYIPSVSLFRQELCTLHFCVIHKWAQCFSHSHVITFCVREGTIYARINHYYLFDWSSWKSLRSMPV